MRYLGIDYGTHRIGIALSDEIGEFAYPYIVLENKGIARATETIANICKKEMVGVVVVGESLDYEGKANLVEKEIKQFAGELGEKTDALIEFENESMTSIEAERTQGKNKMLDSSAAALILKYYLEKQKSKS
ncbi:MAG: Holliday junction resolvase RuvX [Candidatus Vogelbacteria bacterium]|nr:Holliday junction resolvase RuvX [Candidatus Vogelbacteria bacterium]